MLAVAAQEVGTESMQVEGGGALVTHAIRPKESVL